MTLRRPVLSVMVLGIAATAPHRVRAATDVEAAGYAGTNVGGWACGPIGRVKYAGGAGRVRVAEEPARFGGTGWTAEIAGAAERESTKIIACETRNECSKGETVPPPDATLVGGHVKGGHQWQEVGIEAGIGAFEGFRHADSTVPVVSAFPEVELSFGRHEHLRAVVGVGSPLVTMERRPGAYIGGDLPVGPVDVEARIGTYRAGPSVFDDTALRADVAVYVPFTPALSVRAGASATGNSEGGGGEGSVGLRCSL